MNPGNGYISIAEYHNAPIVASLNQYHLDGATPLLDGSSMIENGVVFGATLASNATATLQTELYTTSLFNDSNLISYYRMEGNASDTKGSNNGTATNVTFGSSYGEFGQGAAFNGTSSVIPAFTASPSVSITFSVNLWFLTNTLTSGSNLTLFSTRAKNSSPYTATQYGTDVSINYPGSGGFHGDIGTGSAWLTTGANASQTLSTGTWYMFTAAYSPAGWTYYLNGAAVASGTYSGTRSSLARATS